MEEIKNAYEFLIENFDEKRPQDSFRRRQQDGLEWTLNK
jgi:hypothetical protein